MLPSVTDTAMPPVMTGRVAAATVPNTSTRASSATGNAYTSTLRRSSSEADERSAFSAGSPVRYVVSYVERVACARTARMAPICF